jgi:hypothetical protein
LNNLSAPYRVFQYKFQLLFQGLLVQAVLYTGEQNESTQFQITIAVRWFIARKEGLMMVTS